MERLTVSYGLLPPQSHIQKHEHILPISKILFPKLTNEYYITTSRDGSIIIHPYQGSGSNLIATESAANHNVRIQIHSDWVSDIIEVGKHAYITTSHDFSIVYIRIFKLHDTAPQSAAGSTADDTGVDTGDLDTPGWSFKMRIIGNHDDYIKCCGYFEKSNMFVTAGLDSYIKIWKIIPPERNQSQDGYGKTEDVEPEDGWSSADEPQFELYHTFHNKSGSIYQLALVHHNDIKKYDYDMLVGDCNGNISFYNAAKKSKYTTLTRAHKSNIKQLKLIDDESKFLSTCSEGIIHLWDAKEHKILKSWNWNCSVWGIEGTNLSNLLVVDSRGNINRFNLSDINSVKVRSVFNSEKSIDQIVGSDKNEHAGNFHKRLGILAIKAVDRDNVLFSYSSDSNLNHLNLSTGVLNIERGGFALTKSSLLTSRRHVITENTQGKIQRWDIVSCELINTFDPEEGTFDDVVVKYTSKEILPHWCSVSVRVGILFVKLGPKFLSTQVYGSALKDYQLLNPENAVINEEGRYNLGRIVVNSLFNDFLSYELEKDDTFRKNLLGVKKKDLERVLSEDSAPLSSVSKGKKKSSRFSIIGSSDNSKANRPEQLYASAPSTPSPMGSSANLFNRQTPDTGVTSKPNSRPTSMVLVQPSPTLPVERIQTNHSLGANLSFSRRIRDFKVNPSKTITTNKNVETKVGEELGGDNRTGSTPKPETSRSLSVDNTTAYEFYSKPRHELSKSSLSFRSTMTPLKLGTEPLQSLPSKKLGFMSDFIEELHSEYIKEYSSSLSSLKILSRKMPESKFVRDETYPLVRVRSGALLVVSCWRSNACGESTLFSTYLPPSTGPTHSSTSDSMPVLSSSASNSSTESLPLESANEVGAGDRGYAEAVEGVSEKHLIKNTEEDAEDSNNLAKQQIEYNFKVELFEELERVLPYWLAKDLFIEEKTRDELLPKLNFTIAPWVDPNDPNAEAILAQLQQQQAHHKFKMVKSTKDYTTDLPLIAEKQTRLFAPEIIKVKKIKTYVVERFDGRTPEMKAKTDPSLWLDLLCKNQVLDDDMTLSTVRTLYWKSPGEIVLNYRRKKATGSAGPSATSGTQAPQ